MFLLSLIFLSVHSLDHACKSTKEGAEVTLIFKTEVVGNLLYGEVVVEIVVLFIESNSY